MYVDIVPNRKSKPTYLLRESKRVGKKIVKKTIANISHLPPDKIEAIALVLKNKNVVCADDVFRIKRSFPHGHVQAICHVIKQLNLDKIIASQRTKHRDIIIALIIELLIVPDSKLAMTRLWHTTTIAQELNIESVDVDDVYDALKWLGSRQQAIEKKLAKRHLHEDALVLYDISSSYYEGSTCPLAQFGYNRDRKRGRPIIVYGLMTDDQGRPIAVNVYPGNTADAQTVPDQVEKIRQQYGLSQIVLVGDRGMLTQTQISDLKQYPQIKWISALRNSTIKTLVKNGSMQLSLFDTHNIAEITSPDFPDERLVVCHNPLLDHERKRNRDALLAETTKALTHIVNQVNRRKNKPLLKEEIALKVGKVINKYKVEKHFDLMIDDGALTWQLRHNSIEEESALDGIYVIRSNVSADVLSKEQIVKNYKNLSHVEQAFRTLKGLDIRIRPIRHRREFPVRAHIFLCMLVYYVEWHMRQALKPLLFDDEEKELMQNDLDPVSPKKPSPSAKMKKLKRVTPEGFTVHSFETLLFEMGNITKNICCTSSECTKHEFIQFTQPNPLQEKVFNLIKMYPFPSN